MVEDIVINKAGNLLYSTGNEPFIDFWSPETGKKLITLDNGDYDVYSITLSPDELVLASGGMSVKLWYALMD